MIETYTINQNLIAPEVQAILFKYNTDSIKEIQEFLGDLCIDITKFRHFDSKAILKFYTDKSKTSTSQCIEGDYLVKLKDSYKSMGDSRFKRYYTKGKAGQLSDGYHTFDDLYYHRMILSAALMNSYNNLSWKSKLHADGTMFDNYFIAGIETKEGNFTYHYHIDNWDLFKVKELDNAPEWDGHESKDVTRLLSLT